MAKLTSEQTAFVNEAHVAVLSTIGPDGGPHGAPIWYLYEDGAFLISTGDGSQKHRNVERNPKVSLVMDRRELPYYAVMLRGEAEIGPGFTPEQRRRLAVRYLGEELGTQYAAQGGGNSVTIILRPAKVMEYRGRSG